MEYDINNESDCNKKCSKYISIIKDLEQENSRLKYARLHLETEIALLHEYGCIKKDIELKKTIELLQAQNKELKQENYELKSKVEINYELKPKVEIKDNIRGIKRKKIF